MIIIMILNNINYNTEIITIWIILVIMIIIVIIVILIIIYIIYMKSQAGKAALHYAIEFKSVEIAALLIQHPSYTDVNLTDSVIILPYKHKYII